MLHIFEQVLVLLDELGGQTCRFFQDTVIGGRLAGNLAVGMRRREVVPLLAGGAFCCLDGPVAGAQEVETAQRMERQAWVGRVLERMLTVRPGMTRKELGEVFTTEGGLSTRYERTYVCRECVFFKVRVEFHAGGEAGAGDRIWMEEDDRDVISRISEPFLQFSVAD